MHESPYYPKGDGCRNDHTHRDPCPGFRLLDLDLHFGMLRCDDTEFLLRDRSHTLGKPITSTRDSQNVEVVLGAFPQRFPQHKNVAAHTATLDRAKSRGEITQPGGFQAYAFSYGYIKALIQAVHTEV